MRCKQDTLKELYSVVDRFYDFGSHDFFTEYFALVYDNFGIYDRAIRNVLQQAEMRAQSEKRRRTAYEKFCYGGKSFAIGLCGDP